MSWDFDGLQGILGPAQPPPPTPTPPHPKSLKEQCQDIYMVSKEPFLHNSHLVSQLKGQADVKK
jgi:hypothetical protein